MRVRLPLVALALALFGCSKLPTLYRDDGTAGEAGDAGNAGNHGPGGTGAPRAPW